MHAHLLGLEERIFQGLEIPYRVIDIAAGDLGAPAYRKFDLEGWMPGRGEGGAYGEVTSTSNCTDFQARRLRVRFRRKGGKRTELVHTLNGTAVANSRAHRRAAREPPARRRQRRRAEGAPALRRARGAPAPAVSARAPDPRHRRPHRPRQDRAGARADRRRHRPPARGEGARHHHRARLRASRARRRAARLGVIDVPGHEALVRTMVAGRNRHRPRAAGRGRRRRRDAADPRARRDLRPARRPPRGVVALTKADLADAEMAELAAEEVRGLLAATSLAGAAGAARSRRPPAPAFRRSARRSRELAVAAGGAHPAQRAAAPLHRPRLRDARLRCPS